MCKRKSFQDPKEILREDLKTAVHYQQTKQAMVERNVETLRDQLCIEFNGIFSQNTCSYLLNDLGKEMFEVRYHMLQNVALQSHIAWLESKLQGLL